ncbi:MAG: hypothetical protein KA387_03140 [Rubrivivax sp.]|jgi:hypothetical protein|nr:hypothetical protein [Rubrivivax sp.]
MGTHHRLLVQFILAISLSAISINRANAVDFSVDVLGLNYSYGNTSISPNFAIPAGFPPGTQDPISGWYLTWNALESPITSGAVGTAWRMTMPQAVLGQPDPPRALSSINGYGPFGTNNAPLEWEVAARITNIAGAESSNTLYKLRVGAGTYDPNGVNLNIGVEWFDGDFAGAHYDHLMLISSSVGVGSYLWDSPDFAIVLTDANPADTILDLKVAVSNAGRTFTSSYRIDNSPNWVTAFTQTVPDGVGLLTGFGLREALIYPGQARWRAALAPRMIEA